jgi:hypothetical protein
MISIADPNARKDLGEQLSETVETLTIPNIQIIPHVLTQRSKSTAIRSPRRRARAASAVLRGRAPSVLMTASSYLVAARGQLC